MPPLFLLVAAALSAEPFQAAIHTGDLDAAAQVLASAKLARADRLAWEAYLASLRGEEPKLSGFRPRRASPEALVRAAHAGLRAWRWDAEVRRIAEAAAALPDTVEGVPQVRAWVRLLQDGGGWGTCGDECVDGASVPVALAANLPLVRATVGGHEGLFVVDTGASTHVLFAEWAGAQGIAVVEGTAYAGGSAGGEVPIRLTRADLAVGPMRFPGSPWAVIETRILPGLAGILSPQYLPWSGVVELDVPGGALTLRAARSGGPDRVILPTLWVDGVPFTRATLDGGSPGVLLLDTGAASTRVGESWSGVPRPDRTDQAVSAGGAVATWRAPGVHVLDLAGLQVPLQDPVVSPDRETAPGDPGRDGIVGIDLLGVRALQVGRNAGPLTLERTPRDPWAVGAQSMLQLLHRPGCVVEEEVVSVDLPGPVIESRWSCGESAGLLRVRVPPANSDGWMLTRKAMEAWEPGPDGAWNPLDPREVPGRWAPLFVGFKTTGLPAVDLADVGDRTCGVMRIPAEVAGSPATFETVDCPGEAFRTRRVEVRDEAGEVVFGFRLDP
jgi:hypothetical protein